MSNAQYAIPLGNNDIAAPAFMSPAAPFFRIGTDTEAETMIVPLPDLLRMMYSLLAFGAQLEVQVLLVSVGKVTPWLDAM